MRLRLAWLLLIVCACAHADEEAQREQIRQRRDAIETEHVQREQTCRAQFVVTTCLDKARADKQLALQAVRAQEQVLEDATRRERALARAQRVAEKERAAEARGNAEAPPKAPKAPRVTAPRSAKGPSPKASAPDRRATEQQEREEFEARKREIQAHRQAVEKRNADRAARRPAKPLPVPASAALP